MDHGSASVGSHQGTRWRFERWSKTRELSGKEQWMNEPTSAKQRVVWLQPDGQPVSCEEKLKVLDENLMELRQLCQDAFEDALLMGCEEGQVRELFRSVINSLDNPYRDG
jgi:hypothetical protein